MILWQKQASPQWLAANEPLLAEIAPGDPALISRPGHTRSLVEVICPDRARARKLVRQFGGVARPLSLNWLEIALAEQAHAPIRIGRRLEIVSQPGPPPKASGAFQLIIPAAGAFGTGEHATTAMSLRLLEEITRNLPRGWRLLDLGTGTGILALAARRLGAGGALGLDNDPRAIAHARQNARLNHVSRVKFLTTDVLRWKPADRYDIISANLFSDLLIAALPVFQQALQPKGQLIVSGILRGQSDSVARAFRRAQFRLEAQRQRGKWIAARWAQRSRKLPACSSESRKLEARTTKPKS